MMTLLKIVVALMLEACFAFTIAIFTERPAENFTLIFSITILGTLIIYILIKVKQRD